MKVVTQLAGTRLSFLMSSDMCVADGNDDLIAPTHCERHSVCAAVASILRITPFNPHSKLHDTGSQKKMSAV